MANTKNIKDIEGKLSELCSSFIILFDNLKTKGIISHEEYDTHTKIKKDFLSKVHKENIS